MYSAMADVAEEYQDKELMEACENLWENITQKRMYITGGIGSSGFLERFTTDYDLQNDSNYSETCASIGMVSVQSADGKYNTGFTICRSNGAGII